MVAFLAQKCKLYYSARLTQKTKCTIETDHVKISLRDQRGFWLNNYNIREVWNAS